MRRRDHIAFFTLLVSLLLLSSCGNDATGGTTTNVTKPFVTKYPKVTYKIFEQNDFSLKYPDWEKFSSGGDERQLSLKQGICTFAVNKYNALPDEFLKSTVADNGYQLDSSGKDSKGYFINYDMPRENYDVFSQMRLEYCNYQAYSITLMCVRQNYNEYHEKIADTIFDSMTCAKEYATFPPSTDLADVGITKTDEGEKYGLNSRAVVYLVNHNSFLKGILSKFSKINFLFERQEFGIEVRLKVEVSGGKVLSVDNGWFTDADVTVYMPLMEALNVLSNVHNIDASNIGFFLKNAQTEPESMKQIVLG
jgi:hypothetical protein